MDDFAPLELRGPTSADEGGLSPRLLHTLDELGADEQYFEGDRSIVLRERHAMERMAHIEADPDSAGVSSARFKGAQDKTAGPTPIKPRQAPLKISALARWRGRLAPLYPSDALLSPVQAVIASWWRRVSLRAPERSTESFIAVGDSLSATTHFLKCFAHHDQRMGSDERIRTALKQLGAGWGEGSALLRDSYATASGSTSWKVIRSKRGESPLTRELNENNGRFALVLFGTNDLNYPAGLNRFLRSMWLIGEQLLERGVIPIFSTLPHRLTSYQDQLKVLDFNFAIRSISASMRVPLIDLYGALKPLRKKGLRRDYIHLNAYKGGCDLQSRGLRYGHNMRNYISLKALASTEAHLGAAALRGGGVEPIPQTPTSGASLPAITQETTPWVWLGDPSRSPVLRPQSSAVCKELRAGGMRGVSVELHTHKMAWFKTITFQPPTLKDVAHPKEPLVALLELKDRTGKPKGCLRLKQPHDLHKLAPGQHTLWFLSPAEATRAYLFAIEKRR